MGWWPAGHHPGAVSLIVVLGLCPAATRKRALPVTTVPG
jgi:hypothetical protein